MSAPEDLPPVQPMGPMPGTGSGSRPGPDVRPMFPATMQLVPVTRAETSVAHLGGDPNLPRAVDPAIGRVPTVDELIAGSRRIRSELADAVARSRRARGAEVGRAAA
ncbi:hypothetical protein [Micromonospora rubida]